METTVTNPDDKPEQQPADPQNPDSMTRASDAPPSLDEGDPGTTDDGSGTSKTD